MSYDKKRFSLTKVSLNSHGYESGKYGQYYGIGQPVYRAVDLENERTIEFRSPNRKSAEVFMEELIRTKFNR